MSVNWDAAYTGMSAVAMAYTLTIIVAMASAAVIHGVAKLVAWIGLGDLEDAAAAPSAAGDYAAVAVAIAAAKRYQDTH